MLDSHEAGKLYYIDPKGGAVVREYPLEETIVRPTSKSPLQFDFAFLTAAGREVVRNTFSSALDKESVAQFVTSNVPAGRRLRRVMPALCVLARSLRSSLCVLVLYQ